MRQNLSVQLVLLVLVTGGETRSPQDGAAVGLNRHNEKDLNILSSKSITDRSSKSLISAKPPFTAQPTMNATADITDQPFTSANSTATTQPTTDASAVNSDQPFITIKPPGTSQKIANSTSDSINQPCACENTSAAIQANQANPTYNGFFLYRASIIGDLASVNKALESADIDVNWGHPNNRRATPLHVAAEYDHPEVVTALLNAGADIDRQDDIGQTPLYIASRYGSIDAVTVLIANGSSLDIPENQLGRTALHVSTSHNHPSIVSALLDAGADKNRQDKSGVTPLYLGALGLRTNHHHRLSDNSSMNAVSLLVARGADVNIPRNGGTTPVAWASRLGYLQMVEALVAAKADVAITNEAGFTALHQAARNNHVDIVKFLLLNGADASKQDNKGKTPAALWVSLHSPEMAKILNINCINPQ